MLLTRKMSSLHKTYPDLAPLTSFTGGTVLRNEPFSFQIAYKLMNEPAPMPLYVQVETQLPVASYRLDYIPLLSGYNVGSDGGEERTAPGLYPDILQPRQTNAHILIHQYGTGRAYEENERNLLTAAPECWQSLWFTVNEEGRPLTPGTYDITVRIYAAKDQSLQSEQTVQVKLLPAELPPQSLMCTNWYYADCMCDAHDVELYSDRFFEILETYARTAALHGTNMILTPFFTPPLGTAIGYERKRVQMVKVKAEETADGWKYSFDFSVAKRFIDTCRKGGVTHFEHSHLFTQWGAKAAPAIYADVNGEDKRIFGWDTPSNGEAYVGFLHQYIPAVRAFLREEGLEDKTLFHYSDEPNDTNIEYYAAAVKGVKHLLEGCMAGDALSHYEFFEQGIIDLPIPGTSTIHQFLGKCEHQWCYYLGSWMGNRLPNRVLNIPSPRNRIIGMQLYRYNVEGLLHWGFNHCYGTLGSGCYDPFSYPGGWDLIPGSGFVVYPSRDGRAIPSLRLKVLSEGLNDMRALQALEALTDRETVYALLDRLFGGKLTFNSCPESPEELLEIRRAINEEIEKHC